MQVLTSSILYFIVVFGAGFLLGPLRVFLLVPRVGERTAELIEAPIMFAVTFFVARWIVRRFLSAASAARRLAVGLVALALLLAAEIALTPRLWGVSFPDYLRGRDPIANGAFAIMLILFALMPVLAASRSPQQ
jgi:hypothetical protein